MLFMSVYTYEPENRDAIVKQRAEKGPLVPQGVKLLGEWSSLSGSRVFRLTEGDDPRALLAVTAPWLSLGKLDIYPVMVTEEVIKLLMAQK